MAARDASEQKETDRALSAARTWTEFRMIGDGHFESQNWAKCVQSYTIALRQEVLGPGQRLSPESHVMLYRRSKAYEGLGKNKCALGDAELALRIRPQSPKIVLQAGKLLNSLGNYKRALRVLEEGIQTCPADREISHELLIARLAVTFQSALTGFRRSRAKAKQFFEATSFDDALMEYEQAIEDVDHHLKFAWQLTDELGQADLYQKHFKACVGWKEICHTNAAACTNKTGQFSSSIDHASRALDINAGNVKALYRRGVAYGSIGKRSRAKRDLQRAVKLNPKNNFLQHKLAKLL